MALWLCRAGRRGEYERRFVEDGRIYLTWDGLDRDLSGVPDRAALQAILRDVYPNAPAGRIRQNSGQLWTFTKRMEKGDWVALPSKFGPLIHIAEIQGDYRFDAKAEDPYYHSREVRWIQTDVPRSNFDQDILSSLGAFSAICRVRPNDAEARVRAMRSNGWKSKGISRLRPDPIGDDDSEIDDAGSMDLEESGRDLIARLIISKYKGHGMALLVEAVLRAQGYTTYRSPEGPDKGLDILAAPGPLGFGQPRLAVQVKSGDSPLDRPTLDQLIGSMQNVHADQGLLVSWGGFKSSVDRERAAQFFRVRLWDQQTLIEQILANYERLDEDLRAELPLKRIWTIAETEGA